MNTNELIHSVARKAGLSVKDTKAAVEATFDAIAAELMAGEAVKVQSFGTFAQKVKGERKYRDPKTGEERTAPACNVPVFRPAQWLKDQVN